jgi:uncharacterized 2Fe-2S/4Fe-4S cluster protein (DUF4445 family)
MVTILHPPPRSSWRPLSGDELTPFHPITETCPSTDASSPLGVAVDLGTTHIRLTLWDLVKGIRLTGRTGLNPQASFGGDVMTRLTAACASPESAREIALRAREAIGEALSDMAGKDGFPPARIGRVVIVGNSAMLALLSGKNHDLLLQPAYWTSEIDCRPVETASWCASWGIVRSAEVELAQPLAGFVGSDLLAGVLATRLTEGPPGALLIDFGTNSEIALWDGGGLLVTSAAGGPAFEGCGISCGMPAEQGAVYRIGPGELTSGFRCETIGGGEALGICGSGLADLIACLRMSGRLNGAGRFTPDIGAGGLEIREGSKGLKLFARDIDTFQRAKAAVAAGTGYLMGMAGMGPGELKRVIVCGAFGNYLNTGNAREIGLLPPVPEERIELFGNSALAGCESLLFYPEGRDPLEELRKMAQIVNLAQAPGFEELFVENLYLRPQRFA